MRAVKEGIFGHTLPFEGKVPSLSGGVFVAPGALVMGEVSLAEGVSVWYNAVLRGDISRISVGRYSNIQDLCLLHVDRDQPCTVGDFVVVGHMAILHGCSVGNSCLIGMGSRLLSGSIVGDGCIIAAGAVVLEGTRIPPNSLAAGIPAKVIRRVEDTEVKAITEWAQRYYELSQRHLASLRKVK